MSNDIAKVQGDVTAIKSNLSQVELVTGWYSKVESY